MRPYSSSWLVLVLMLSLASAAQVRACIWDRDTLAAEAKGLPEVVQVITGRFERNPPLYYRLRLQGAAASVQADPMSLEAYDDAGVACDRLGRGTEAIRWMERKREVLDRAALAKERRREHRYRYLANVGTFRAHRWFRQGADRRRIGEVRKARDAIRAAIRLNPDAHFGRERYQLLALEWILDPPEYYRPDALPDFLGLAGHSGRVSDHGWLKEMGYGDAVQGLSGLIVLGDAWESVDVFHALACALQTEGRSSLSFLAQLRCSELIDAGRASVLAAAPRGEALKQVTILKRGYLHESERDALAREYRSLRREADAWHAHRTAFMMARLQAGRHPDTDSGFWNGYSAAAAPGLSGWPRRMWWTYWTVTVLPWAAGLMVILALIYRRRRATTWKTLLPEHCHSHNLDRKADPGPH